MVEGMPEYIKREDIKYELWPLGPLCEPLMVVRKKTVDSIPAADVAPVVRCRECVNWRRYENSPADCNMNMVRMEPDGF